jgi:Ankyrin repeats (3 copies)/F-box-like
MIIQSLSHLPDDILLSVIEFCEPREALRLQVTCRDFRKIVYSSMQKLFCEIFKTSETFGLPRKEFFLAVARTRARGSLRFFREIFCFACALGLVEFIEEKIRQFPEEFPKHDMNVLLDASAADGCPALSLAVINGHSRVITVLLAYGASPNKKDKFGKTPLLHACKRGDFSAVEILINCGANLSIEDASGKNSLQLAMAAKQNRGLCVELISRKISEISNDENFVQEKAKISAIFFDAVSRASESGDLEILKSLTRNFQALNGGKIEALRKPVKSDSKAVPPLINAVISKNSGTIKVIF